MKRDDKRIQTVSRRATLKIKEQPLRVRAIQKQTFQNVTRSPVIVDVFTEVIIMPV